MIILLHKKQVKTDSRNYRTISLLSTVCKIIKKILIKRPEKGPTNFSGSGRSQENK